MHRVTITGPAGRDIEAAYDWWAENRSAEQATRWYLGIHRAITSLRKSPECCQLAPESDLHELGLRQIHFGLSGRPTHRVVFVIDGNEVVVLRVGILRRAI